MTPRAITGPWPGLPAVSWLWRNISILPSSLQYCPPVLCPPPSTFDIGYFIFNYNLMVRPYNTLVTTETGWVPGDPSEKVQCYEYSQLRCRAGGPGLLLCSDTSDLRSNGARGTILDSTASIHTATLPHCHSISGIAQWSECVQLERSILAMMVVVYGDGGSCCNDIHTAPPGWCPLSLPAPACKEGCYYSEIRQTKLLLNMPPASLSRPGSASLWGNR